MFVSVGGVRLFFDVLGPQLELSGDALTERPVLLCLHGGPGGDHQTLRPDLDRLGALAQVVYLDQRGGGRSEAGAPDGWTLDRWGDDVAAFCDAVGIEQPIVLGVSGGSVVAQAYLARHPDHARAAILVNAAARFDRETMIAQWGRVGGPEAAAAARAMYERGGPEDGAAFFRHCLPHYAHRRPYAPTGAGRARFNFAVSQHFFAPGGEAWRFDHRGALGQVACPVLVCAGAHDPVTPAAQAREAAQALPPGRAEFVLFEQSSHAILADEPERFFEVAEAFLARV